MNLIKNTSGNPTKTDEGFPGVASLDADGSDQFAVRVAEAEKAEADGTWSRGRGITIDGNKYTFDHEDKLTGHLVFRRFNALQDNFS